MLSRIHVNIIFVKSKEISVELSDLRRDFGKISMEVNSLPENPIELFKHWLKQASDKSIAEFNAMVLSTVNTNGKQH